MAGYTQNKPNNNRFAVIIPVFNHQEMILSVIRKAMLLKYPVFVVDDGSTDSTFEKIKNIKGISILRHTENLGKGAAIITGIKHVEKTADWIITIDADGQHNPQDALKLISSIPGNLSDPYVKRPVVIGMREKMLGKDVPWTSRFGRKFSNFWVHLSGGPAVKDSQSGFRIYPVPEILKLQIKARRYQFEVESLVKAGWKGLPVIEAPVSVSYSPGSKRISHFRPFIDFLRNSSTFTRLIAMRIIIPRFLRSRL